MSAIQHGFERYRRYYTSAVEEIKKPKQKNYVSAVLTFLSIALFGWFAIRPTVQTIFFLQREIRDKEEVNSRMETKISQLIEAQAAYQRIQPELSVLQEAVPSVPSAIELIAGIQQLAVVKEATVASAQVSDVPLAYTESSPGASKKFQLNEVQSSINVLGTFSTINAFTQQLLNSKRIITFNSLSLTPDTESGQRVPTYATRSADFALPLRMAAQVQSYYSSQ